MVARGTLSTHDRAFKPRYAPLPIVETRYAVETISTPRLAFHDERCHGQYLKLSNMVP